MVSKNKIEEFFIDLKFRRTNTKIVSFIILKMQEIFFNQKSNLPLNNLFLCDLKIFEPSYRCDTQSVDAIVIYTRFIIDNLLSDEWSMYSIEIIDDSWFIK